MTTADDVLSTELAARIAFNESSIERWTTAFDRPDNTMASMARAQAGFKWFDIAVCRLLLDDAAAAASAFAHAAELVWAGVEIAPEPVLATHVDGVETAVLAGDWGLAQRMAAFPVVEARPSLVHDRLHWASALLALVAGDDEAAAAAAAAASQVPEKKLWYPGLGGAVEALLQGDPAAFTAELDRVLDKHGRYARARKSWCYNSCACLLCVPATVLARMAARRGVVLGELRKRRATVPLALVHSAPDQTLDIEVDFVPDVLTVP